MIKNIEHRRVYDKVHQWIRYNYGPATFCSNWECFGRSKIFEWALIKGKSYEKNIENFKQLCRSCHRLYDFTEAKRNDLWRVNNFKHRTHCPQEHEYSKENTRMVRNRTGTMSRHCIQCGIIRKRTVRTLKKQTS